MANNRLERVGTIFTRITGLLRAGALKPIDKPIWYEIYKHHPPKYQPKFGRPKPNIDIRPIFYTEDVTRAKIHKNYHSIVGTVNLGHRQRQTNVQKCLEAYNSLIKQNHSPDEAVQLAVEQISKDKTVKTLKSDLPPSLSETFLNAKKVQTAEIKLNIADILKK